MQSVGDYEYDQKNLIGHGAFALVYKGRQKRTNVPVAIKCISKKNLGRSNSLWDKEINILKRLHHENIVQLYECKVSSQSYVLVMEFCNGGDLADYLRSNGTLREDTIRHFFRQIALAMKAMHDQGILHRDLKPQNLLLSHKGTKPKPNQIVIKIADFGFARHLQNDMMAATLCGSPMYMAPEVITSKHYNAKADLWSIGTIIYQCLVGRSPFHASTPQELRNYYEQSKKVEPKIPSGTSSKLADLLLKLLKRKVEERINFTDFFHHEFFSSRLRTSPVPVPVRSSEACVTPNSSNTSDSRSVVESPQVEIECSPSVGDPLFLGSSSSSSDSEDFVMIPHPFSTTDNAATPQRNKQRRDVNMRKNSVPLLSHKPVISHRKQLSQGSPRKSVEDREIARTPSRDFDPRSPFMQRTAQGAISPITIRYSAARRRTCSGSDSDASSQSRPSPVPLPVPTQTENFQRLDRHVARLHGAVPEERRPPPSSRPRSMSPLCANNKFTRRFSVDVLSDPSNPLLKGMKVCGSPVEIPTIMENPRIIKVPDFSIARKFQHIFDSKPERLTTIIARAWTAPDLARVREDKNETIPQKSMSKNMGMSNEVDPPIERNVSLQSILKTDAVLGHKNSPETEFRFYNQLSDTICEVAEEHTMFSCNEIQRLTISSRMDPLLDATQKQKQGEQLLLFMKSLQLVATGLHTLRNKVNAGNINVTREIQEVARELNQKYKKYLELCENAKVQCEITEKSRISLTSADKVLYFKALQDCQSAVLDELLDGNIKHCLKRYERSLVLLEGLSLATNDDLDRVSLSKLKKGIRFRLVQIKQRLQIDSSSKGI